MKPSTALRAGATATLLAIAALLAAHELTLPAHSDTHVSIPFDGGVPADTECIWATALASPGMLGRFGLRTDAGSQYVIARVCASPMEDAGVEVGLSASPLRMTERTEVYDGGQPRLEAWLQGDPDAPFRCACSSGADCTWSPPGRDAGEAPIGLTLQPGSYSGAGCVPKPCIEWAGKSSMPAACVPDGGAR